MMRLNTPDLLVLDYTRVMMGFLLFIENPKHIGMVGLGGGSIQKHCYRHLPDTRVTVAEICPEIIALRNRFFIPGDDHRFQVLHEDGAQFVKRRCSRFDVLLVDGFDAAGQPEGLCSTEFYDDCYRALAPEGIMVVNCCDFFPRPKIQRMRHAFEGRIAAVDSEDSANTIVFAGKGNVWWKSAEQLRQNQMHVDRYHSIDLRRTAREFLLERGSSFPPPSTAMAHEPCQQN